MRAAWFDVFSLRDYQDEAVESVLAAVRSGERAPLVVMPTGLGKTIVFAEIVRRLDLQGMEVVVVIAHSGELLEQAEEKFRQIMPGAWIGIEKASVEASGFSRVIVASVQTLKGSRLDAFIRQFGGRIRALVIDEAHRAAAKSYKAIVNRVLENRPDAFVMGFTATPRRGDRLGLGIVFTKIAYNLDLRTGIERGYLVPIRGYRVDTETSLDKVAVRAGDFVREQVARAINHPARNRLMVDAYQRIAPHSKAVVFTVDVAHAIAVTAEFVRAGFAAEVAHGEMSRDVRRAIVDRFRRGETRVLVNCALFLEGFDVADIETILLGRPARSPVIVTQAVGRGTRPHPSVAVLLGSMGSDEDRCQAIAASAKGYVNVIDMVDASRRHQLVTLPTLFGLSASLEGSGRASAGRSSFERLSPENEASQGDLGQFDHLEATFEEVDFLAAPRVPVELAGSTTMTWREWGRAVHRLTLPQMCVADTCSGERLANFDELVRIEEARAREAGSENAYSAALAALDVDPKTIRPQTCYFEIRATAEGWEAVRVVNGVEKVMGARPTLVDMAVATEEWIRRAYPWVLNLVSARATWRRREPKPWQISELRRFGLSEARLPRTRGEAADLLEILRARRKEKVTA